MSFCSFATGRPRIAFNANQHEKGENCLAVEMESKTQSTRYSCISYCCCRWWRRTSTRLCLDQTGVESEWLAGCLQPNGWWYTTINDVFKRIGCGRQLPRLKLINSLSVLHLAYRLLTTALLCDDGKLKINLRLICFGAETEWPLSLTKRSNFELCYTLYVTINSLHSCGEPDWRKLVYYRVIMFCSAEYPGAREPYYYSSFLISCIAVIHICESRPVDYETVRPGCHHLHTLIICLT